MCVWAPLKTPPASHSMVDVHALELQLQCVLFLEPVVWLDGNLAFAVSPCTATVPSASSL